MDTRNPSLPHMECDICTRSIVVGVWCYRNDMNRFMCLDCRDAFQSVLLTKETLNDALAQASLRAPATRQRRQINREKVK